jgi:hypothetical protein
LTEKEGWTEVLLQLFKFDFENFFLLLEPDLGIIKTEYLMQIPAASSSRIVPLLISVIFSWIRF